MSDKVVILPWVGEFGWMIVQHVHYVHWYPARTKVVCCKAGHECLFPSAAEYYTDWINPIPENERSGGTRYKDQGARDRFYESLRPTLKELYPDHEIVVPEYSCYWHMSDAPGYTFRPEAPAMLPPVDVVLGARRRSFDPSRNWPHWSRLAANLKSAGLRLGMVGSRDTTVTSGADVYAWDHPHGDTPGSVDLLAHCRLYIGVDSGMTHLAGIMSVPMLIIGVPYKSGMSGIALRANKSVHHVTHTDFAGDVDYITAAAFAMLNEADAWHARPIVEYEIKAGDDLDARVCGVLRSVSSGGRVVLRVRNCRDLHFQELHRFRDLFTRIDALRY